MKKLTLSSLLIATSMNCFSAQPIFLVTPNITVPSTLISGESSIAVYQITNNTQYTLNNIGLAQMPGGVVPNTNAVSPISQYCTNPFNLTPHSSCLLKVQLNTSGLGMGGNFGPKVCYSQSKPVYCSQPFESNQISTSISPGPIPQDCNSNVANFNYELIQSLDSLDPSAFVTGWGPRRNNLFLSPSNPNLTNCPTTAGIPWEQQRIIAAAIYWIKQKLNYCHHYNPDYATPPSGRGAAGNAGGYCNPEVDIMPGSVYYGQQARWNYSGQGSETANNWVNNNQMWYGMDCSNYTAFLYNFAFGPNAALGIPFDSKTGFQAGQQSTGCVSGTCPQDNLSPNTQVPSDPTQVLNNPDEAGKLVCVDGTIDPTPSSPTMCTGHGGYLSSFNSSGARIPQGSITAQQVSQVLQPGDILFIAGSGANPDGTTSMVTHAIMWLGKQVGYGPNDVNPSLIAPDDGECAAPNIWQPHVGDWVITDSHYQGADYRVLTTCFYLNNLWGVRRVLN